MKRLAIYYAAGAVVALGITTLAKPARAQTLEYATDYLDSSFNVLAWKVNQELPNLPGPGGFPTLDALRGAGLTDSDIEKSLDLLVDYKDIWITRRVEAYSARQDRMAGGVVNTEYRAEYRTAADKIWAQMADRIGIEKTNRVKELVGYTEVTRMTQTAYSDEHLRAIDQMLVDWDRQVTERAAMLQQQTIVEQRTARVIPVPAPVVQPEAPVVAVTPPAPVEQVQRTVTPQPQPAAAVAQPANKRAHRSRGRRVRGLG